MKKFKLLGTLFFTLNLAVQSATATPEISVEETVELDLDGSPQAFTIDVANIGLSGNLTVSAASFGEDPNFLVSALPDPIIPGDSDVIGFVFNPMGGRGLFSATLTIESDDPVNSMTAVAVSGAIHDPMFSAATTFNVVNTGPNVIPLTNTGATQTLSFTSVSTVGTNATAFKRVRWPFFGVDPGASDEITFNFEPGDSVGTLTAQFRVFSNDPIESPFIIDLIAEVGARPFQVTDIRFAANGEDVTISWNSTADTNYAIDRSTDLSAAWIQIQSSVPSTGTATSFTDTDVPTDDDRFFYRVRVVAP